MDSVPRECEAAPKAGEAIREPVGPRRRDDAAGFPFLAPPKTVEKSMRFSLPLVFALLSGTVHATETEFLFDALHGRTPYHASWDRLMRLVQPTPDWLVRFNRNFDGVAGQITSVTIDGKPYSLSFVCKPTDCEGHKFVVLF